MSRTLPRARRRAGLLGAALGLACALFAGPSAAQIGTVLPEAISFNASDCFSDELLEVQYDIPLQGSYFWSLQLTEPQPATGDNCPRFGDAPPVNVVEPFPDEAEIAPNGEFQLLRTYTAEELLGPLCSGEPDRGQFPLCIYFSSTTNMPQGALDIDERSNAIRVAIDTDPPARPLLTNIDEGDRKLSFSVGGVSDDLGDVYTYELQYRPCEELDGADGGTTGEGAVDGGSAGSVTDADSLCEAPGDYTVREFDDASFTLSGLTNDVQYEVRVVVEDDFGNRSEPGEAELAIPRGELTPLDLYDGAQNPLSIPGPDCESCTQNDATMGLLGLGLLSLRRLRRRREMGRPRGRAARRGGGLLGLGLVLALGVGLAAPSAQAYPGQLTVGLKAGPYKPAIDSEVVNGQRIYPIYECFFTDGFFPGGILPNVGIDVDMHVFDMIGSLELGVGMTFTQAQGMAAPISAGGAGNITTRTCPDEEGTESVELTIAMFKPQLTYRLDPLYDYYGVPLIPYARIGAVSAVYAFTQNGAFDNDSVTTGKNPLGMTLGAEASAGLMLALNWFDVRMIWDLVAKGKIEQRAKTSALENAYVFGEVTTSQINNLGYGGPVLHPTDALFNTGLPWTFQIGMAMELW